MDTKQTIIQLREDLRILDELDAGLITDEESRVTVLERIAASARALDDWASTGGFAPEQWPHWRR